MLGSSVTQSIYCLVLLPVLAVKYLEVWGVVYQDTDMFTTL